ncbi:SET domain-containing protein upSET [Haematobia irritans]|uniref:SET domain-containing protein upSET n=2 Tax=Haematobia irritans TaxID=7368 RepID=UPI003F4FF086
MPQNTKPLQHQHQTQQQHQKITKPNSQGSSSSSNNTTTNNACSSGTNNNNSHIQHVQQVHLVHTSAQQQHNQQKQQLSATTHQPQAHMIQISEEFIEKAQTPRTNHTTKNTNTTANPKTATTTTTNMMISATGEVIQQQQIFKIVSTDATTGNMIIDTSAVGGGPQNPSGTSSTTSKVLLSNLTVLSKQSSSAASASGCQQSSTSGQTINFVNAKQLYAASTPSSNQAGNSGGSSGGSGIMASTLGKQQKFTVSSASLSSGNFKPTALKQTTNTQYTNPSNVGGGPQKISMSGNRNIQMLTTARVQTTSSGGGGASATSHTGSAGVIANNATNVTGQTMVVQQPQKFVTSNSIAPKSTLGGSTSGNIIKKAAGSLRMNNNNNTNNSGTLTKLMNLHGAQTSQAVKTFITQTSNSGSQQQNNNPMTSFQQHHTKGIGAGVGGSGGKSKFIKQYSNAIINSAGAGGGGMALTSATVPSALSHQQQSSPLHNATSSSVPGQYQASTSAQQHSLTGQSGYMNHHKVSAGAGPLGTPTTTTKINKINSKYTTAGSGVAAQLPPGTQLQQKSLGQGLSTQQQQQYQSNVAASANSNIKFVNAQGTIVQQQQQHSSLTPQKIHIKQQQQHPNVSYPSIQNQNFDTLDGGNTHLTTTQQTNATSSSTGTGLAPTPNQLNDDIMMVNGTQMTDEISARILQSMSQKSFINQRYQQLQQQQQPSIFQKSPTSNNNSSSSNSNMLPPPQAAAAASAVASVSSSQQSPASHTQSNTNNPSNILLSPREYTLYPPTVGSGNTNSGSNQQQISSSPQQQMSATASTPIHYNTSSPIGISSPNYLSNSMATITTHSSSNAVGGGVMPGSQSLSTTSGRLAQSAPSSRSQSMERKLHESSISRKSTEYYKVNNHNSLRGSHSSLSTGHSSVVGATSQPIGGAGGLNNANTTPSASASSASSNLMGNNSGGISVSSSRSLQQIPMVMDHQQQHHLNQSSKTTTTSLAAGGGSTNSCKEGDDIIGEEIRPVPVETQDIRLQILHAVLLDHTYANPMPLQLPTTFAVLPSSAAEMNTGNSTGAGNQQWSLGGIGAVQNVASNVPTSNYTMYTSQLSRLQQDDDAYSAISNNSSRPALGDIDPGEETETAPEAEAEDDSVTRCICDLTHDDGYMICCDKCCAWQHVDCMGIDRQNIPDEYLCELCQPRPVDKARARALQVQKRKEQTQMILVQTQQAAAAAAAGITGAAGSVGGIGGGSDPSNLSNDTLAMQRASSGTFGLGNANAESSSMLLASNGTNLKKGSKAMKKGKETAAGKKSKKAADKLLGAGSAGGTAGGKAPRKETKKNTKRKKTGHDGTVGSTVGMTAAEKHAANLRQWIENYELAVTNHYSPELRARLIGIQKQPSLLQSILNTENPVLKEFSVGHLENRSTTVPHAGGKILISNMDITPNSPICELRGKYLLTTQFKTQNTSINMNSPPPNNYQMTSYKAHKTPGPFVFFYQVQGSAVGGDMPAANQQGMAAATTTTTTTTLNADGTFTTTTTTLPAQLSPPPPAYLKGPEICVDTRTYGNEARFVRRSCRPNAEIQHLFEKGTIHLFIVALTDIRASTEITIRHEPHDLLAVEHKKSNTMVIQPTSTACACGLSKDCIFGPPLPQLPPAAKSNAGRKSQAHNSGGGSSAASTAKQRKAIQQNLNRNRSTSSSGDSNMGCAMTTSSSSAPMNTLVPSTLVPLGLNSPNSAIMPTVAKVAKNIMGNCNNAISIPIMPSAASCNSNLSNASSTSSSTLASGMHDSGICTSSSSPSVSIPSPTAHMHSPIQQTTMSTTTAQQLQQQHIQGQVHQNLKTTTTLLPQQQQQQQQQIMQSLPTPLILTTDIQQGPHNDPQEGVKVIGGGGALQIGQQVLAQSPQQPSGYPVTVVPQSSPINPELVHDAPLQASGHLHIITPPPAARFPSHSIPTTNQLVSPQLRQTHQPTILLQSSSMEITSPEATIAATALQSLNCSQPTSFLAAPTIDQNIQQTTPLPGITPPADVKIDDLRLGQNILPSTSEVHNLPGHEVGPPLLSAVISEPNLTGMPSAICNSVNSSPQEHQQQQHRSPQKNNQMHTQNMSHHGRKTPAKQSRTTSFSEDSEQQQQQHGDETSVSSAAPNSSSTPKEKPKLSREDRKMEAILRAIEKMERNQQRKQEQKQTKRQSSGSHNTTPTSPNKTFESGDSSGTKRSNSQLGAGPTRTKKRRKAGNRGGAGHNNQRKRRQSRINSQESVDGGPCGVSGHDNDTVTSESDGCAAMHSPPIETVASSKKETSKPPESVISQQSSCEAIPNNVDQAAGLLMAFANPIAETLPIQPPPPCEPQSPQRPQSHYNMTSNETTTSPPPTPPSHLSSACLLIEAAVGPLESNLDANCADVNNAEFKYPPQAKTKKLLMNNWLHRTEDTAGNVAGCMVGEKSSPNSQLACVTGGLDSLVQAALNDFKQTHSDETTELPQNLSIVAQRVEEFIQQTEGGPPTPPPTKHSYEYEQQQQQMYAMSTPAVDLSLKHPIMTDSSPKASTPNNKNFHLPLQVSTCSNNSSVKKRWLRQAISEETHEEVHNTYSLSPSPTTPMMATTSICPNSNSSGGGNPPSNVQAVTVPTSSPTIVPNGFTTPLKKRRLLLTDKDDEDSGGSGGGGNQFNTVESNPSGSLSPLPVENSVIIQQQQQQDPCEEKPQEICAPSIEQPDALQCGQKYSEGEIDVDVEKCEQSEIILPKCNAPKEEVMDQDQDIDVTSPPLVEQVKVKTEIFTKHEEPPKEQSIIKQETTDSRQVTPPHQTTLTAVTTTPAAEFNDQEDDVDILRSPSPGREMIKAEDNLVKIEPEDTSGNDDVKIDVEREESMPADDVIVPQNFKRELKSEGPSGNSDELKAAVGVKHEPEVENLDQKYPTNGDGIQEPNEAKPKCDTTTIKSEVSNVKYENLSTNESDAGAGEPKPKKPKLEENQQCEKLLANMTEDPPSQLALVNKKEKSLDVVVKEEPLMGKENANTTKASNHKEEEDVPCSSSVKRNHKGSHDNTFIDASTPPLPSTSTSTLASSITSVATTAITPLQSGKISLSDDDIQARLHNFHKENILFLQSRNKKSKSNSSTTSSSSTSLASNESQRNNHKNNSSLSANHHHHHQHESKERSEKAQKLSTKHHKNSSSSSGSSSKKQKLYKRERTTSSSSSSNSHKNSSSTSSTTQVSTSSKHIQSNSNTNSLSSCSSSTTSSSKKPKSLKKSSSGSSTSSCTSSTSSAPPSNCHPPSSSNASESKEKHHRQRTTSSSNSTTTTTPLVNTTNTAAGQMPFMASKKRQLNFELELTKDLHLVNSVASGSGKHRRQEDNHQAHGSAKKSRKDSSSSHSITREEQKIVVANKSSSHAKSNSVAAEKPLEKEKKTPVCTTSLAGKHASTNVSTCNSIENISSSTLACSQGDDVKKPVSVLVSSANVLREHPTLPHFNNVVCVVPSSSSSMVTTPTTTIGSSSSTQTVSTQLQTQSQLPTVQHIPVHVSSPSSSVPLSQSSLPVTPPPPPSIPLAGMATPLSASSSHLPFFNTIYGKLLDNPTPVVSTGPIAPSPLPTTCPPITPTTPTSSSLVSTGVLSEYLDTKLKSYNTLGGYVTHSALFGLGSTPSKDIVATLSKDAAISNEMPAPPTPSSVTVSTVVASSLSLALNAATTPTSSNVGAMKMLTKTASHDPRLNPQLTAPEPPPQPKRKLSINEYRKRMQQTSSNESASNSLASTPTTPPSSLDPPGSTMGVDNPGGSGVEGSRLINKCTLNSPEHLTQSVDSQIQKAIIASSSSSSLNVYDSLNSSNSSSTSNSSLLNDSLLKPSSHAEEDTTKGQFNAAPTLLEKQQESICARLKSLKEKQGLNLGGVGCGGSGGSRSRFSSFSESVGVGEFSSIRKDDDLDNLRKRNLSISSSIGGMDLLDNCLEEISSNSTSMSSSRESSPDRYSHSTVNQHSHHHSKHVLTASATTSMATTTTMSSGGVSSTMPSGHSKQQHAHHHSHSPVEKTSTLSSTNLERKKSVDIA